MRTKTSNFKPLKSFQASVVEYSFEEKEGILALVTHTGKVALYFLYQAKGSKAYLGASFDLFSETVLPNPFASNPEGNNLLKFTVRLDYNQVHVFKIYDTCYFVHLDNINGSLRLFKVFKDKSPQLFTTLTVMNGIYSIGVSENLIFLQSYQTQETFIYDIQSQINDFLVKVRHFECNQSLVRRTSAEISSKTELNGDSYFVSDTITVDLRLNSFNTLKINPSDLIENHPDDQKIILFLLRRDNCKSQVLERIKDFLLQLTPIKKLDVIFSTLASAYAKAKQEKKNVKRMRNMSECFEHLELVTSSIDLKDELKVGNGVTVLMQSDIYFFVFDPVYKSISEVKYFAQALLCYAHWFVHNSLNVHFSIQYLIFKVLVKIEDFKQLQNLVENQFFSDSEDIALFLTSLGKTDICMRQPQCYILGIDMLARLKKNEELAQELADQNFFYEALEINKIFPLSDHLHKALTKNCDFFP